MKEAGPTPNEKTHSSEHVAEPRPRSAEGPPAPDYVPKMGEGCLEAMRWLNTSPPELSKYGGKWVVASGRRVCAAADGAFDAVTEAERAGVSREDMLVTFVEDVPHVYPTALP